MGMLAAFRKDGLPFPAAVGAALKVAPLFTGKKSKGMDAPVGQAPLGIARNGNMAGAMQATQGQRSWLGGALAKPGSAGQKTVLGG